ncbi:hypothetical protein Rhopal_001257-T1 [Rhodotorula paludigena]|uniref:Proteophosphoglycan ppg4 n=1 Tax=Rhodotorula paludigena TaxID=86838 RepID=A0AAV5GG15_9BASI|nr:hypothetical protein Rhopal_001257-T1 [Rhodotorula paludigena]
MFAFSRPPPHSHSGTGKPKAPMTSAGELFTSTAQPSPAVRPAKPAIATFTRKVVRPAQPQASAGHERANTYLPTPSPAGSNRALSPVEVIADDDVDGVPIVLDEDSVVRPQEKKRKIEPESDSDSLSSADSVLASAATTSASRRVVLFDRWTSFTSDSKFFDRARALSLQLSGHATQVRRRKAHRLVAACSQRLARDAPCGYRVEAEKVDGLWVLDWEACVWEHSHDVQPGESEDEPADEEEDPEEDTEEEHQSASPQKKRRIEPEVRTQEKKNGPSDDELFERSTSSAPVPVPGLPKASDTFATVTDAYSAYVKAIVPVYGIGLYRQESSAETAFLCNRYITTRDMIGSGCAYKIALEVDSKTGRWKRDTTLSVLKHSHGPAIKILRDPNWRPTVRNADARKALGMPPFSSGEQPKTKQAPSKKPATSSKAARPADPSTSSSRAPAAKAAAPQRAGEAAREPVTPAPSLPTNKSRLHAAPSAPIPAPTKPPASSFAKEPPASSPPSPILPFLAALHSSLTPLAPHLSAAGFSTPEALTSLVLLEPAILDMTLEAVWARSASKKPQTHDTSGVSVIQAKLLARLLKDAGEELRAGGP